MAGPPRRQLAHAVKCAAACERDDPRRELLRKRNKQVAALWYMVGNFEELKPREKQLFFFFENFSEASPSNGRFARCP